MGASEIYMLFFSSGTVLMKTSFPSAGLWRIEPVFVERTPALHVRLAGTAIRNASPLTGREQEIGSPAVGGRPDLSRTGIRKGRCAEGEVGPRLLNREDILKYVS